MPIKEVMTTKTNSLYPSLLIPRSLLALELKVLRNSRIFFSKTTVSKRHTLTNYKCP
jgi:hypothetical protein